MFSNHFITIFPRNAPVKKFWKSVNIWQWYGQKFVAYFFMGHPVGYVDIAGHSPIGIYNQNTVGENGDDFQALYAKISRK